MKSLGSRRRFLGETACGLGAVALGQLFEREGCGAQVGGNPLAPKPPHFAARAKSVIFLFMAGAPSQLDLFEQKPELKRWHGQPIPQSLRGALVDTFKQNA